MKLIDFVDKKYKDWIFENYPSPKSAYSQCTAATILMVNAFPELKRVRGLAYVKEPHDLPPTKAPHWWCVAPDGTVVDPTHHQYTAEIIDYDAEDTTRGEPTGKCPNCGDLCYEGDYTCTEKCHKEYVAYITKPQEW